MNSRPLISIRDLDFRYPADGFRLRIPSFEIREGEKVAVIGSSGSGKTTLAGLIAGILTPRSGRVSVAGADLRRMGDASRRDFRISTIGFIFQEFELLDYLRAEENIILPFLINRTLRCDRSTRDAARELARALGIAGRLGQFPRQLSQGERQRVAICRALITRPRLIIADEPTGNLDPKNAANVLDMIKDEMDKREATFLMITHERAILNRFDRVVDLESLAGDARDRFPQSC